MRIEISIEKDAKSYLMHQEKFPRNRMISLATWNITAPLRIIACTIIARDFSRLKARRYYWSRIFAKTEEYRRDR